MRFDHGCCKNLNQRYGSTGLVNKNMLGHSRMCTVEPILLPVVDVENGGPVRTVFCEMVDEL